MRGTFYSRGSAHFVSMYIWDNRRSRFVKSLCPMHFWQLLSRHVEEELITERKSNGCSYKMGLLDKLSLENAGLKVADGVADSLY